MQQDRAAKPEQLLLKMREAARAIDEAGAAMAEADQVRGGLLSTACPGYLPIRPDSTYSNAGIFYSI